MTPPQLTNIRPFIGSEDFETSRHFYKDLGFEETALSPGFSVFTWGELAFYLQANYVKDWVDNTQIFVEVTSVSAFYEYLTNLNITQKYKNVRIQPPVFQAWGCECFVHDPSGILWHFGQFN